MESVIAPVGIVASGAVPLGHGLVNERAITLHVTECTQSARRDGEGELVGSRVGQLVAGQASSLRCRGMEHASTEDISMALGCHA